MNYYAIYDRKSDKLIAEGNARECQKKLKCASIDSFYALANRSLRGTNKKYKVIVKKAEKQNIRFSGRTIHYTKMSGKAQGCLIMAAKFD